MSWKFPKFNKLLDLDGKFFTISVFRKGNYEEEKRKRGMEGISR